jgi:hypothetical protein
MLNGLGVDIFYLVDFTLDFAVLSPKQFVDSYLLKLEVTQQLQDLISLMDLWGQENFIIRNHPLLPSHVKVKELNYILAGE